MALNRRNLIFVLFLFLGLNSFCQLTSIRDFTGESFSVIPRGIVATADSIYVVTEKGGANDKGTLFRVDHDGNGYVEILSFDENAYGPNSLIGNDTILYGTTQFNDVGNSTSLFSYKYSTGEFQTIKNFNINETFRPQVEHITDTVIWCTSDDSSEDMGSIFTINHDGSSFTKIYNNTNENNGQNPVDILFYNNKIFIAFFNGGGIPYDDGFGGTILSGSIGKVDMDGQNFTTILQGSSSNGTQPISLKERSGIIYGVFQGCGASSNGRLFKVGPDGLDHSYLGTMSTIARGDIMIKGDIIFGMTSSSIWAYDISEYDHCELLPLDSESGFDPTSGLVVYNDEVFLGTQQEGALGAGGILKYDISIPDGPTMSSISPISGPVGTSVTIDGTGFDVTPSDNIVYFGPIGASVSTASSTQLTVTVPNGAGYSPITVLTNGSIVRSENPFIVTFSSAGIHNNAYKERVDISTDFAPIGLATGDFDNDGKVDFASAINSQNILSIFRNISTGPGAINYASKVDVDTDFNPREIVVGDFDNDGKLDLVVTNEVADKLSVFRNNSSGPGNISFEDRMDYFTQSGPKAIAAGDINDDGKLDLVVTEYFNHTVSYFKNIGSEEGGINFNLEGRFVTGGRPASVLIEDVDNDGRKDILTANETEDAITVLRNRGSFWCLDLFPDMNFLTTEPDPAFIAMTDIDNDGLKDLVVVNKVNMISVFRNNSTVGTVSFTEKTDYSVPLPSHLVFADFNGDGNEDIAVAGYDIILFENLSTGIGDLTLGDGVKVDFSKTGNNSRIAVADIDEDGKLDLLVSNANANAVRVFRNTSVVETTNPSDSLALVSLYNANNGINWWENNNWLMGNVNTWYGVNVDLGRVDSLNLNNNNLTGALPAGFFSLPNLRSLNLRFNQLNNNLPSEIENFSILEELDLYQNDFNGPIPNEIGNLTSLEFLDLAQNQFSGSIPTQIGNLTELSRLILNNNQLTGQLPTVLGSLTNLNTLKVETNQFTGSLISDLGNLTALSTFTLGNNSFTGSIPTQLGNLVELTVLTINDNELTGSIPDLSSLQNLNSIQLHNNQLTGSIPIWLGSIEPLEDINLSSNLLVAAPDFSSSWNTNPTSFNVYFNNISFDEVLANISVFSGDLSQRPFSIGGVSVDDFNETLSSEYDGELVLAPTNPVSASPRFYQWEKDMTAISEEEEEALNLQNVKNEDEGDYQLKVSNQDFNADLSNLAGTFDTSTDAWCGSNGVAGTATWIEVSEGIYETEDFAYGTYLPCYGGEIAKGTLQLKDVNNRLSIIGVDQWGDTWFFNSVIALGNVLTLEWENTYGEFGITTLTRTDGNDWPPLELGDPADEFDPVLIFESKTLALTVDPPSTETDILNFSFTEETGAASIDAASHIIDIEVDFGTSLVDLIASFDLSTGATAEISSTPQVSGTTSNNFTTAVTYTISAQDGTTTQDWTVSVTIAPNTATDFLSFSFVEQVGTAIIDAVNHLIDLEVLFGTDASDLTATFTLSEGAAAAVGANPQNSGNTSNDFTNPVTYSLTAQDGVTIQDWNVTVSVEAAETGTDFMVFSFAEQTGPAVINDSDHTVSIEVANGVDLSGLIATFELSLAASATVNATAQISGTTANDFTGALSYTITAQDGSTQDWIVMVSEAADTATDIITFEINDQVGTTTLDNIAKTVSLVMPFGTDLTDLVAIYTTSTGATASVSGTSQSSGTTANDFTDSVTYTITAEDGTTTQDWTVTITIAAHTATDFTSFSLVEQTGPALIDAVNHTISLEVAASSDLTVFVSSFELSSGATASVGSTVQVSGTTANDFTNPLIYTVTAEDGTTSQDWTVTITIAAHTATDFTSFSLVEQTGPALIDAVNHTISLEVAASSDLTVLVSSFELSSGATTSVGSTVQVSGTTANDFTNPLIYTVMAEDGTTTQDWTVTITVEPLESGTDILEFSLPGQLSASIEANQHAIAIDMDRDADITSLAATFSLSTGASAIVGTVVQISAETTNDFTNPITYTVIAEDGAAQDWIVTITKQENNFPTIANAEFVIDENTEVGVLVGSLEASDDDGDALTYAIKSGNELGAFEVEETTGEILVSDSEPLDFETSPRFELTIKVEDGFEGFASAAMVIELEDVDEVIPLGLKAADQLNIYPNPVTNRINIDWKFFKSATIMELSGKVMKRSVKTTIDASDLKDGIYLLSVTGTSQQQLAVKFIKN